MPQIEFRQYYTTLVEHYFRLAVRSPRIKDRVSEMWQAVTLQWLNTLSNEDKEFIQQVFKYENRTTRDGLLSYGGDYRINRARLYALEKAFAVYTRIIDGGEENEQ